jgi:hypothetical protein
MEKCFSKRERVSDWAIVLVGDRTANLKKLSIAKIVNRRWQTNEIQIRSFYRCTVHFDNVKISFFLPTNAPFIKHIKC